MPGIDIVWQTAMSGAPGKPLPPPPGGRAPPPPSSKPPPPSKPPPSKPPPPSAAPPPKPSAGPPAAAAPPPRGEDAEAGEGFRGPAKVSLNELLNKDAEDESLRKYKESLLGAAASGVVAADPNDKRRVIITELKIVFHDRPGGDVTYTLNTPEDLENLKKKPFIMKEKCLYKTQVSFRVQHDIVSGLKYVNKVYKSGIRVSKDEEMLGSYAPQAGSYTITFPRKEWEEAPSGWLARGNFTAESVFVDDDNVTHLAYKYGFELKSGWT
mmetsp:Transcript_16423/g.39410  ORF Transcript_16423/g.39410 Transcript_16423/m.39410 type:complete len:268 (-) Transcript_16423:288-1091(-)